MKDKFRFPYLLVGMGLVAIAGLLLAPGAVEEMWKYLRERSHRGLDILNKQAGKLRESAEGIAKKGKEFIGGHGDSVKTDTAAERQAYQEERRENSGG